MIFGLRHSDEEKKTTKSSLLVLIPEISPHWDTRILAASFYFKVAEQKDFSGEHDQFRGLKKKKKYQGVPQNDTARSPNSEPHG